MSQKPKQNNANDDAEPDSAVDPVTPPAEWQATILDSISDGVFTVSNDWKVTSFNRAAERITGIPREEALGQPCCDVFRASICESECALRHTRQTGEQIVGKAIYIIDEQGRRIPISISTAILEDRHGNVLGGVETFRDLSQVAELRKELNAQFTFADIISRNHRMQEIFAVLPQIADSGSTVLIEGESGTGKELVARALHDLSPRRDGPFVTVNCAALPDTLLESELFGHKRGAFTGAVKDKPGRFALADGGTLLLDEIGDISPALQVRLLRVLQERTFTPLGGTVEQHVDVHILVATHRDLAEEMARGTFREDLYYRINVMSVELPPLRERREDVPLLVDHFIARHALLEDKDISGCSPEAMAIMLGHDYPGNIRELENIVQHAVVLCRGGQIEIKHLPRSLAPADSGNSSVVTGRSLEDAERLALLEALRRNDWNRVATARELGIHKSTLYRKIASHGLELPEQDGRHSPQ